MDSSDSVLTQESHPGGRSEPVAIVTPHLLLAVCGLLDNLLAVLPEFSLSALKQNQILQGMARLEISPRRNVPSTYRHSDIICIKFEVLH